MVALALVVLCAACAYLLVVGMFRDAAFDKLSARVDVADAQARVRHASVRRDLETSHTRLERSIATLRQGLDAQTECLDAQEVFVDKALRGLNAETDSYYRRIVDLEEGLELAAGRVNGIEVLLDVIHEDVAATAAGLLEVAQTAHQNAQTLDQNIMAVADHVGIKYTRGDSRAATGSPSAPQEADATTPALTTKKRGDA